MTKATNRAPGLPLAADDWPADYESQFWAACPRRVAKKTAMKALAKVRIERISFAIVLAGMLRYAEIVRGKDPQYMKHPATWLNAGCWDDEHPDPTPPKPSFFQQVYGNGRQH